MNKTLITALCYTFLLILISTLIVSLSPGIHQKVLTNEKAIENDKIFTNYFQTNKILPLANIEGITGQEVKHMYDVRKLLIIGSIIGVVLAIIILIFWENQNTLATLLSPLLILGISIPNVLLINFNKAFETFHKILFPQGNYSFPMDSVLITTYHAEFFMTMGLFILKFYLFISIGFLFIKIISDKLYILMQRF